MLRVLPPTFKLVLQQVKVGASCVNTDFWLDKFTRKSRHTQDLRHLLQNKFALGRQNIQHVKILFQTAELLLPFCNKVSQPSTTSAVVW